MEKQLFDKIKCGEATFIIVKNNTIVYEDSGIGVKPIMKIINYNPEIINGAVVADKVIGKAAAMLLCKFKARYVCGILMSRTAIQILKSYNVEYKYENLVDTIKNRTNDDLCPLEKCVANTNDIDEGIINIKNTIAELMKK
ncbi:MAG: hypothetical protein BEN19_04385 [Epulopiscium sp. Nuni2H_MBin003]|nr:MAG: hypothetical protein BEN19_04385 [Epulopiscium sp. Nuni2H_MBin003]